MATSPKSSLADPKDGKPTRVRFEEQGRQEGARRRQVRGDNRWLINTLPRLRQKYNDKIVKPR